MHHFAVPADERNSSIVDERDEHEEERARNGAAVRAYKASVPAESAAEQQTNINGCLVSAITDGVSRLRRIVIANAGVIRVILVTVNWMDQVTACS